MAAKVTRPALVRMFHYSKDINSVRIEQYFEDTKGDRYAVSSIDLPVKSLVLIVKSLQSQGVDLGLK